jgi:transposase
MTRGEGKTGAAAHTRSTEERLILAEGVSISQLAQIFSRDKRTVSNLIRGLRPVGERMGYPVFDLGEAAGRLAEPDDSMILDSIKKLKPTQLPVKLQKEFWDAARSRQRYLEDQADLWRTQDIVDALIEVFKQFKQGCNLMSDAVARETDLTVKQRTIINDLTDSLLDGVRRSLFEDSKFSEFTNVYAHDDADDLTKLFDTIGDAEESYDDETYEYDEGEDDFLNQ